MRDLKIFAKTVEPSAQAQIDLLLAQEAFEDCKVRIMPDVHTGAGCVIGFTANLGDKVIPNIVGVDIGCGMLCVRLEEIDIDYKKLDDVIRQYIPSGKNVHTGISKHYRLVDKVYINKLICKKELTGVDWICNSLGTLGGGNHFIEIDVDDEENKYLVVHSGSRNLGKQVADIYQRKAVRATRNATSERSTIIAELKEQGREKDIQEALDKIRVKSNIPKDLCYIEGVERKNYIHDMKLCQIFAIENRIKIAMEILRNMGWEENVSHFEAIHNYIDDLNMVRKGAISAHKGEGVIIPINMRDGCIIGTGLGNPDWNYSAPHGAGRIMSRSKAKEIIPMEEYKDTMQGIYTTSVNYNTIDEAPQAYKPIDEILECIKDTVKVEKIIKPVYNFKASE